MGVFLWLPFSKFCKGKIIVTHVSHTIIIMQISNFVLLPIIEVWNYLVSAPLLIEMLVTNYRRFASGIIFEGYCLYTFSILYVARELPFIASRKVYDEIDISRRDTYRWRGYYLRWYRCLKYGSRAPSKTIGHYFHCLTNFKSRPCAAYPSTPDF